MKSAGEADSPEKALAYSASQLGHGRRGPITVYDYSDGPPGIVSLGDCFCVCEIFSEAEHRRMRFNPQSWEVNKEAARIFYRQRKLAVATRLLEKATELAEADFHSRGMLSAA